MGDLSMNHMINDEDVSLLLKYCTGKKSLNNEQLLVADVNEDGYIDILNAIIIEQRIS